MANETMALSPVPTESVAVRGWIDRDVIVNSLVPATVEVRGWIESEVVDCPPVAEPLAVRVRSTTPVAPIWPLKLRSTLYCSPAVKLRSENPLPVAVRTMAPA